MKHIRCLTLFLTLTTLAGTAEASPWTLKRGRALLGTNIDFQFANSEFIDQGGERRFPLDGAFLGATFNLSARLGVTDEFEIAGSIPLRFVSYISDPVILVPYAGAPGGELAYYQANVVDFSQVSAGLADFTVVGRYSLIRRQFVSALEVEVKAPTGYQGPTGTFGEEPRTVEAFDGSLVDPGNVRDDVSLGDAQLDIAARILTGISFPTGTFAKADVGYKLRLGGAGDQLVASARMGQTLSKKLLIFGGAALAYSIQQGRSVGVTITAVDPSLPADSFVAGNTRAIVRRLETNFLDVTGGFIWRLVPSVEMNVSYSRTLWGRYISATNTFSFGLAIRAALFSEEA